MKKAKLKQVSKPSRKTPADTKQSEMPAILQAIVDQSIILEATKGLIEKLSTQIEEQAKQLAAQSRVSGGMQAKPSANWSEHERETAEGTP